MSNVPKSEFGNVIDSYKGSTGTLLNAAYTEEKYAISWTSPKTQIYELPTGVACISRFCVECLCFVVAVCASSSHSW